MNIRHLLLLSGPAFALLLLAAPIAVAQPNMSPEQMQQRFEERADRIIEDLAVTGDRSLQVREILMSSSESVARLMRGARDARGDRQQMDRMRAQRDSLDSAVRDSLAGVLTGDELHRYDEIVLKMREERRARFGRDRPAPPRR